MSNGITSQNVDARQNKIFPTRLRKELDKQNLSQQKIASTIGVSRQTINSWCLGMAVPDIDKFLILSKALNVSCNYLLGEDDCKKPSNQEIYDLLGLHERVIEKLKTLKWRADGCPTEKGGQPTRYSGKDGNDLRVLNTLILQDKFERFLEDLGIYVTDYWTEDVTLEKKHAGEVVESHTINAEDLSKIYLTEIERFFIEMRERQKTHFKNKQKQDKE